MGQKSGSPRENLRFFSWGKNRGPRKVPQCNEDTLWGIIGVPAGKISDFSRGVKNRGPRKVPQCNEDTLWGIIGVPAGKSPIFRVGQKTAPLTQGVCAGRFFVDLSRGLISHSPMASASTLSLTLIMCPVNSPLSATAILYLPALIFSTNLPIS